MALRLATFNLKDFFLPQAENERAVVEAKLANVARRISRATFASSSSGFATSIAPC